MREMVRLFCFALGLRHEDEVVGVTHETGARLRYLAVEVVEVQIGKEGRYGSPNAKDNFRFERTILGWRGRCLLDLRRKR